MARRKRSDYLPPVSRRPPPREKARSADDAGTRPGRTRAGSTRPGSRPVARSGAAGYFPPGTVKRVLVGGLLLALVLGAVAYVLVRGRQADRALQQALTSGSCEVDERSDPTSAAGNNHVPSASYAVDPPSAGDHSPQAARAGVYRGEQVPPDGLLVHSLEHGYVVLWHRPDLPEADRAQLERLASSRQGDVVVAERASLPVPVAATAWEQRLLCQAVEPAALERFAEEYVGEGPEDVARG